MKILSQDLKGKLTHVCKKEVEPLLRGEFKVANNSEHFKPNGVWISWENGWEDWCASEQPDWLENREILSVTLKPNLKIFLIDSLEDFEKSFDEFSKLPIAKKKFKELKERYVKAGYSKINYVARSFTVAPDFWDWIRKKFDGVAVTNKGQCETRFPTFMYGWDCQSVCIYNPKNLIFTQNK